MLNLVNAATVNMNNESYEKSLIQSRTALQQATLLKDNALIALTYNTIGGNFDGLFEYEKALFYYKKGLIFANKTNEPSLKYFIYNNLGNIYFFDKKEYKKGIYHYKKSLAFSAQLKDTTKMVFTKINMAWAYFDIKKFDEGYSYLQFVNNNFSKHGDESLKSISNMLNGMYFCHKKDTKKATRFFENAVKFGIEEEEKSDLSYAYLEYSRFLKQNGAYKNAYLFLEKYNKLTEEINSEEKIKKARLAGINLELDEYKREINKISNTYKSKETYWIEQQSRNKKIVILVLTLSLLVFVIFYAFSQNEKLKQYNRLKEIQSKVQQNVINATIDGQESERKKIAAFLHDNISALLSSAGMHLNVFSAMNQNQSDEIIKTKYILEEAHHKVRDLSHELMPSLLVRFGLLYALDDLCEKNSNSKIKFDYHNTIETHTRFEEAFEMKLFFIVSELLNNILKHSGANRAKLETSLENNQLFVKIKDNGKGFDDLQQNSTDGYGINRIKARINNMNGEFIIKSRKNQGTTIKLHVPIV
ncbi:ATP-binding protein [Flavobacterium sp.]|uniref:tetratricopeptide repeat-containing sensor histidine kinase n=1 Tax=Flavobacterium sp. TaxID=239 RepID=UPI00262BF4D5|nr:ATP-binding protein [Flavobacterium sp.]